MRTRWTGLARPIIFKPRSGWVRVVMQAFMSPWKTRTAHLQCLLSLITFTVQYINTARHISKNVDGSSLRMHFRTIQCGNLKPLREFFKYLYFTSSIYFSATLYRYICTFCLYLFTFSQFASVINPNRIWCPGNETQQSTIFQLRQILLLLLWVK